MDSILIKLKDKAINTAGIDPDDAEKLYEIGQKDPFLLYGVCVTDTGTF